LQSAAESIRQLLWLILQTTISGRIFVRMNLNICLCTTMCLICRMDIRAKGETHSRDAIDRHNEYIRQRRENAKKNGMCIMCIKRPARKGSTMCEHCLAKARLRAERARRDKDITPRFLMDGNYLCARCGVQKGDNGHRVCDDCYNQLKDAMLYARSFRDPINHPNYFERTKEMMFIDA
jgi:hypothetical protein